MLKTIAPNITLRWIAIIIQYTGVAFFGACFFHFVYYMIFRRDPRKTILVVLYALSFFNLIFLATNPFHYLFYTTFDFYSDTFGPLFYWHALFTYILIFTSIVILIMGIMRKGTKSKHEQLLSITALLPLFVNFLYLAKIIEPLFDYTPIAISLSLFFLAFAAFRHHFLGVLPVAYDRIVKELENSIVILDRHNRILYGKQNMKPHVVGKSAGHVFSFKNRKFRITGTFRRKSGIMYQISDITRQRILQEEHTSKNRELKKLTKQIHMDNKRRLELAVSESLNHARRELHDFLGHSMTQIILLLESAKLLFSGDISAAHTAIGQAEQVCQNSLNHMNNTEKLSFTPKELLSESLQTLAESFSFMDFRIELTLQGLEQPLPPRLISELYRCCQEAITNGIKHGHASKIDIMLQFKDGKLLLLIADNGCGTENCTPGEGLRMMEDHLQKWNAILRYESSRGEGFLLSILCPLKRSKTAPGNLMEYITGSAYPGNTRTFIK